MRPIISFNVPNEKMKNDAKLAATLRGENLNQAMLQIFEFGLAVYKEKVPLKFELAETTGEMPLANTIQIK